MPLRIDQFLLGKYHVLGFLGEGAFGRAYLAEEELTRRKVAIKELRHDLPAGRQQEARERFEREIQIGSRLEHPHIVKMYTHERQGEDIYLVLEYMEGGSLRQRLDREGALPVGEAVRIATEICEALECVHSHPLDLVHRDVTPRNILFGADGTAKLTDFGVVQSSGHSWTHRSGEHPGDPFYRAPEASRTDPLRPAADVYMLGCVLWEMLTGRVYKHSPGTRPGEKREEVLTCLDELVMTCLKDEPADRPKNGESLLKQLREVQRQIELAEAEHKAGEALSARNWDELEQLTQQLCGLGEEGEKRAAPFVHALARAREGWLSAWNPLHWLLLLWWITLRPDLLKAYTEPLDERGLRRLDRVLIWLVSTLEWLLVLLLLLCASGGLPIARARATQMSVPVDATGLDWQDQFSVCIVRPLAARWAAWMCDHLLLLGAGCAVAWLLCGVSGWLRGKSGNVLSVIQLLVAGFVASSVTLGASLTVAGRPGELPTVLATWVPVALILGMLINLDLDSMIASVLGLFIGLAIGWIAGNTFTLTREWPDFLALLLVMAVWWLAFLLGGIGYYGKLAGISGKSSADGRVLLAVFVLSYAWLLARAL